MDNNLFDKIIAEIESGNFKNAIHYCNDILSEYSDNRSVYEIRSGCYYAIGEYELAISDLTSSILKANGGDEIKDELAGLYSKRGKIFQIKKDWIKSSEDYKKVLHINENLPEIHNRLALCYRKMENYIDALYHSSKAIKLDNLYAEAYNNRANINISLEKYNEAVADYTQSIELSPSSANAYFNRGSIYYDILNNKEEGVRDFLKSISINPDFEEELKKHYPELINTIDSAKGKKEEIIHKEEVTENSLESEMIAAKQEDSNLEFSPDDFAVLFNIDKEEKPETTHPKTEEPLTQSIQEVTKSEDIIVPEFDLKSIFSESNDEESIYHTEEEPILTDRPVISEDVKSLHDEIQTAGNKDTESSDLLTGRDFGVKPDSEVTETAGDLIMNNNNTGYRKERKDSFLRSPFFFIILIILMIVIVMLSVYKFFNTQDNQIVNIANDHNKDSNMTQKTDTLINTIRDTISKKESEANIETEKKTQESVVKEETPVKEVKQETALTTKNLGFISDKKQFVLFSEPDGYYVQIGSYKEKQKAEEKLKFLENNKIKGKVTEIDLKEKGIFYRVRAGVFSSPEEAKEKIIRIE